MPDRPTHPPPPRPRKIRDKTLQPFVISVLLNYILLKFSWTFPFRASPSYFDTLPADVNSDKDGVEYEQSCSCSETQNDKHTDDCVDGIPVVLAQGFLNQGTEGQRIKKCHKNIASRKKREIRDIVEGSDDLTDEDFRLFYNSLETHNHKRSKRLVNSISKENATRYCNEKLAETPVGKLCAKMGTNVQALVNVCSSDIEVSILKASRKEADLNSCHNFMSVASLDKKMDITIWRPRSSRSRRKNRWTDDWLRTGPPSWGWPWFSEGTKEYQEKCS